MRCPYIYYHILFCLSYILFCLSYIWGTVICHCSKSWTLERRGANRVWRPQAVMIMLCLSPRKNNGASGSWMGVSWISQSHHVLRDMFKHQNKWLKSRIFSDLFGFHNAPVENQGSCWATPSLLRPSCCWCFCRTRSKKHNGGVLLRLERSITKGWGTCYYMPLACHWAPPV